MLRPFDKQWIKEANAVRETLRRRLPEHPNLHEYIDGGLVFTHGVSSYSVDSTSNPGSNALRLHALGLQAHSGSEHGNEHPFGIVRMAFEAV